MGLSSSKSKTTSNQTSTATTTPNNPQWVEDAARNWSQQVSDFGKTDPYSLVAGPSALQQQAFSAAGNLLGTGARDANNLALERINNVANSSANLAGAQGYNPATATAQGYQAQNFGGASVGPAQNYTSQGYYASVNDPARLAAAQAQGYTAQQAAGVNLGSATGYQGQGYEAALGTAAQIAAIERAQAERAQAASMLENFSAYQNPATQSLVNATMASFDDQAGRTAAAQKAAAAKNKAFGGSRYGIEAAQLASQSDLNRNLQEAQLRDRAFTQAVGMSQYDATNRQNASSLNAQLGTNVNIANAGFENNRLAQNAQMATNTSLANAGFTNSARAFGADAANRSNEFNAGALNNFALTQGQMNLSNNQFNAGANNAASQFGANAFNQASQFNAGQQNNQSALNQSAINQSRQFNADASNTAGQFNAGQNNQFALTDAGFRQQAGLANMDANNQAAQFNTGAQNQFALTNAGAVNDASQFNANAFNQNSMFNAGQMDNSLDRQLSAASLGSQVANSSDANSRANLGLLGDLGAQQQQLEALRARAPAVYMELMAALQGSQNFGLFRGETTNGTSSGVTTTKQSQPWGAALLGGIAGGIDSLSSAGLFKSGGGAAPISSGFSDIRLKTNVEKVGENGPLGIYEWTYRNGLGLPEGRYRGVMAQEVARFAPHMLGEPVGGYMTVRYTPERIG